MHRCWLTRELDSHLVEPGEASTIDVNRCFPRPLEGDWCEAGWCADGLECEIADGATRGTCEAL